MESRAWPSVPCPSSEGDPAGGEMLLPLQQPRVFHPQLPAGEGIQNWPTFKLKGGNGTKVGSLDPSRKCDHAKGTPGGDAQGIAHHAQIPFLNPNPFHQWYGIKNKARVRVKGESCMALPDNGMQINTIMLGFVENRSLDVVPLSDLGGRWVVCIGLGNALTWPMGYVIIHVQVEGVQDYDEDQIALVILDLSDFEVWVPMILGTPTISHVMNVIKEKEIDALATPCINAHVAYPLAVWPATATVEDNKLVAGRFNPTNYDEVVITKDMETIDTFSSHIICVKTETVQTGMGLNVMTQALHAKDGSLSQGLTIQNTYTELCSGSKDVAVVVRNSMAYPQTLKKTLVVRQLQPPMYLGCLCKLGWWKLQVRPKACRWQSCLWNKGRRNCSRSWMWADWYPGHLSWHTLPGLSWLNTLMSLPWSPANLVVLIQPNMWLKLRRTLCLKNDLGRFPHHWWKKSVHFCKKCWIQVQSTPARVHGVTWCVGSEEGQKSTLLYRFLPSQCPHQERLLPVAEDPGSIGEFGRCWSFFMPRPKIWILANQDRQVIKTVHHVHCLQFRLLWVWLHDFWVMQCASHLPMANAKLPWGTEPDIMPHLPWWHSHFLADHWGTPPPLMSSLWPI